MKRFFLFTIFIVILLGTLGPAMASSNNVAKLQEQVNNLTKENRELKAQLANLTRQLKQLKAENEFLRQQNEEYRSLIQGLLREQAKKSEQDYIEKAKKERLIGSVLLKTIIFSFAVVGLIGYGLYRIKRRHDFAGL